MSVLFNRIVLLLLIIFCFCQQIWAQCNISVTIPNDITVCEAQTTDLNGTVTGNYIYTSWEGTNGFNSNVETTSDFTINTTQYTFTAYSATDNNLVLNGDFEDGNQDFTSDYGLGEVVCNGNPYGTLGCEGAYTINTNPSNTHTDFANCGDHTSGTGNMMIINGSSSPVNVWCQDISITPNTDYYFSAWAMSVVSGSPANLQFAINGNLIGNNLNLSSQTCFWQNFTANYFSGGNTTATICVSNLNTAVGGNDFALDDIEFLEVCKVEESFTVLFSEPQGSLPTSHFIDCSNPEAFLEISPADPNSTYNWESQFGGVISGDDDTPGVFASAPGLYQVTITDMNGCSKELSTTVNGSILPPETMVVGEFAINCDNNMVTVYSTNTNSGNMYNWVGSANNSTSTSAIYDEAGTYVLEITNSFHCTSLIFFDITEETIEPDYSLQSGEVLNCIGDSTTIHFNTLDTPEEITWFDPQGNAISDIDSVVVYDIGYYSILLEYDNGCTFTDSVQVTSLASELDYILGESPTITCLDSISNLEITINSDYSQVSWIQDTVISYSEFTTVNNPGLYVVEITDNNGCITRDSINILSLDYIPDFTINVEEIDCISGIGSLTVMSDSTITTTWENQNGDIFLGDSISNTVPETYYVRVENSIGCSRVDTVNLPANQDFPSIHTNSQNLNCANNTGIITIESNIDNTLFDWTGPGGFTSNLDSFSIEQTGSYIYTATTQQGCSTTDTIVILGDFDEPTINLETNDTLSCINHEITIDITSNVDFTISEISTENLIDQTANSITIGSDGSSIITIQGENGCLTTEEIITTSNFETPDSISIANILLNCFNPDTTIELNPINNTETIWYNEAGEELSNTIDFYTNGSGTFTIIQTNENSGCSTTSEFYVLEDFDSENVAIVHNDINCLNSISNINLITDQTVFSVDNLDGAMQVDELQFNTANAGNYNFIVTYSNGCTSETSVIVEIDTISPIISAEDKAFTCMKEPLPLTVNHNLTNASFNWSGPEGSMSTDDFLFTAFAGLYYVTVTNTDNGCFAVEDIIVLDDTTNLRLDFDLVQPLCDGESGAFIIDNIHGGTAPYNIVIFDETNTAFTSDDLLPTGNFNLILEDYLGCDTTFIFQIDEVNPFEINTEESITITLGESTELQAETSLDIDQIESIAWTPSNFLSCSDCLNPTATNVSEDTWFTLSITDKNGCIETDSILVRVVIDYSFYFPNTFSPNDDGNNDIFYIQSNKFGEASLVESFLIYDRWGNKVHEFVDFQPNDLKAGWNGSINNQAVSPGVYAYFVRIILPDGSHKEYSGDITVLK